MDEEREKTCLVFRIEILACNLSITYLCIQVCNDDMVELIEPDQGVSGAAGIGLLG